MITRQEAIAELTADGMPLELQTVEVHGNPLRVFKNAPDSLRDVWLLASKQGEAPYSIYEDKVLTYGDAQRQVVSVAAWLTAQGVKKGDRVALGMRNYPEWAIAFWSIQCIGAVMVSLNAWWIADELKYALLDSGATAVIVDGERQERLSDELLAELSIGVALVARGAARPGLTSWEEAAGNTSAVLPDVEILADDFATILYTSGTTGFPKGAAGTHRNYITNVWNNKFSVALAGKMAGLVPNPAAPAKAQTVALSTFPFFHIAGLCGLINNTTNGVCVVTQFKWDAGDALRIVEKYKVNTFGGVPTVVRSFLEHPDFSKFDLSSISAIGQGGAPVPPDSVATIEAEFSGKVSASNGYGLTETTAAVIGNSGAAYFAKKDSVGFHM